MNQFDIKKIIAFSTCSQLGYMFLACGFSGFSIGLFHLIIHAFFKALLFLLAGYLIHTMFSEQDIRFYGSAIQLMPFSFFLMIIGILCLIGVPYFSGNYSKEKIIELLYNGILYSNIEFLYLKLFSILIYSMFISHFCIICTIFYNIKTLSFIYFNDYNNTKQLLLKIHYIVYNKSTFFFGYLFILPLILLSIISLFIGYYTQETIIGFHNYQTTITSYIYA